MPKNKCYVNRKRGKINEKYDGKKRKRKENFKKDL